MPPAVTETPIVAAPEERSLTARAIEAVADAVGAAGRATFKTLLLHTLLTGMVLGIGAFVAASRGEPWRGVLVVALVLATHGFAAVLVLAAASLLAVARAIEQIGVARRILAAAAARAAHADPRLAERNNISGLGPELRAAFDQLEAETRAELAAVRGLRARLRIWVVHRLYVAVATFTLSQLDLMPRADGASPYRTIDEWIGARIDRAVLTVLRNPAMKMMIIVLLSQFVATVAAVAAVRALPGLVP